MITEVTEIGLVIPKSFLTGIQRVEIRRENNLILIVPIAADDPIWELGQDPVDDEISDASINHDAYLLQA
ncbi:MAG: hypothetical protein U0350_03475 [Caldilineaceae bacterium]